MLRGSARSRALGIGAATLLSVLSTVTVSALAAGSRVYTGGSRKANRYMDIQLQVLPGGTRANWRIDVFGPCTEHERLARTIGTDAGATPPDPRLQINDGRFVLHRHARDPLSNLNFTYTLTGHAVPGGFVGTLHYAESNGPYRCDSHLLHWRAHRTSASFP